MTDTKQSLHWADQVASRALAWQKEHQVAELHVDDMKTPSGRVHTGALRGVMIHDIVAKILASTQHAASVPVVSTYVFNDMDPMDGLPSYLEESEYSQHMGKPLFTIPAPALEKSGIDTTNAPATETTDLEHAKNFAEYYARDFIHAFRRLGCDQEIVWSHELYQSGKMDDAIRKALNSIDKIKQIYREVADYQLPESWYPFQAICQNCGKLGTTTTTNWDGEQITYTCEPEKVAWARGCGHTGRVSPFGGTGKLLWKVDWPAHWKTIGVTVEGAGKDHTSAGGSRDMANAFCAQVFDITPPFDIPYEWILIRGAKMSSSKGVGTSAREFTELFPTAIGRFLFTSRDYNQVIDFDPTTMAIPDLFDEYDQAARLHWQQESGDQRLARSFELAQIGQSLAPQFLPRFRDVALWMQYPEIQLEEKFAEVKGSALTQVERDTLTERKHYAQLWLDRYASAADRFGMTAEVPETAASLTAEQREFLANAHTLVESQSWQPAELQQALFELAKQTVGPKAGFQSIYLGFIGKKAGPRAAWFLLSLDVEARRSRFEALTQRTEADSQRLKTAFPTITNPTHLQIAPEVAEKYPSISLGLAIIKGVTIHQQLPELEQDKASLLESLSNISTETIGALPAVQSYRKLYKSMGVDWHSRRPSPEALLRRVAQGKELYTVNTCVDAYNLVVMKHGVSVGAFDLAHCTFPTILHMGTGSESILLLGNDEPTVIKPGELYYADQQGPYNLDFNYRDSQRTAVTLETTDIMINVDGVFDITREQVEHTLRETIEVILKYCGGSVELAGVVSATS